MFTFKGGCTEELKWCFYGNLLIGNHRSFKYNVYSRGMQTIINFLVS